jgi:anti-sigma regulatory factor (Ser/Thr protein kinase)
MHYMKVHLSNYDYLRNFDVFLRGLDTSNPNSLEITTNDKWIGVHPAVLTLVAALGMEVDSENIKFDEITARSGHYLDTMGLFKILKKASPFKISSHEPAGRFIPLTQIRTQKEQSKFISEMIPLLHLEPNQVDAIKYTVGEIVRNVIEHSMSDSGAIVAAQYSQKSNTIRLGICDTGIGIPQSIGQMWHSHAGDDLEAVKWALVPGVSGTTMREGGTSENAGAGLFYVKSISMVTRDYFVIYSGSAVYRLLKRRPDVRSIRLNADPSRDKHGETDTAPYLKGTLIGIDISLDQIDEFAEILKIIRNAYVSAITARRKARFKRPQFI